MLVAQSSVKFADVFSGQLLWIHLSAHFSNSLYKMAQQLRKIYKLKLGNLPQEYSHLALIETAINLLNSEVTPEEIRDNLH